MIFLLLILIIAPVLIAEVHKRRTPTHFIRVLRGDTSLFVRGSQINVAGERWRIVRINPPDELGVRKLR